MKTRPILFSGPMIRALLAGTKTQTRRIAKPQPISQGYRPLVSFNHGIAEYSFGPSDRKADGLRWWRCPYGQPGDRLWVREAWKAHSLFEGAPPRDIPQSKIFYMADDSYAPSGSRGRPGIHMPRWASRLTLTLTDVRVERLQDISEADALAEGTQEPALVPILGAFWSSRDGYARLWEHINGPGSWDVNPWVWAISFDVHQANVDSLVRAA